MASLCTCISRPWFPLRLNIFWSRTLNSSDGMHKDLIITFRGHFSPKCTFRALCQCTRSYRQNSSVHARVRTQYFVGCHMLEVPSVCSILILISNRCRSFKERSFPFNKFINPFFFLANSSELVSLLAKAFVVLFLAYIGLLDKDAILF